MKNKNNLQEQVTLLHNNINVFDIAQNHFKEAKKEVEALKDGMVRLAEQMTYLNRTIEICKEGFQEIQQNLEQII